ncbi:DNA cytosine methyltransferase [Azospirillum brasilense]|uniref:DNA cytosine methyltransferase n=1 Tax=Azospirillum brasilense TaxID=192 RepID=UPI000E69106C|nr:DNA cytosine methyltransferase [Azospirillum brasilense]NUB23344.1 DNA (cytosine-5-)-methyltransferase [Azospirillum brasilense]NUB30966.1 DNA (cytosine-5-)-methyltransferase [Azospirillum brasilense]RIW05652.1 DNA cytosine methyltransferase [Azospirillum brasilense]
MSDVACVDLFCGAGGLTHGLMSEGIKVVAGIDVDEACRHPFETNNAARFINEDVASMRPEHIAELFGSAEVRVLAGCAPCQPFSTYAQRYDVVGSPRWGLLYQFGRLIKETRPDLVTMENVPSVAKHAVFDDFIATLRRLGYHVHQNVVDCSLYGLPQSRRRMVLLASRLGPIELNAPTITRPRTVRDAIGKLTPIVQGGGHPKDALHAASKLSELNLQRIQASRPGGTWRDWPKHLVADCHQRETGRTYPGVYGRMVWDEPAPTLTTQFYGFGNGRFGHPEQDRAISLREGAILQGFPKSYSFIPKGAPVHFKALGRMIGNAVPVTLGKVIGQSIAAHLGVSADIPEGKKKEGITGAARKSLVA